MKSLNMCLWLIQQDKLRYTYPLNKDSIVFDVGGYSGLTAWEFNERYGCKVYVFEPVEKYYKHLYNMFSDNDRVIVLPFGLGGHTRDTPFQIDKGSSSLIPSPKEATENFIEIVKIKDIIEFIKENKINKIDVLCLNIEGMEYELLNRIIKSDLIKCIKNIQIQFHRNVNGYGRLRQWIVNDLRKTHYRTYNYPFIFEN